MTAALPPSTAPASALQPRALLALALALALALSLHCVDAATVSVAPAPTIALTPYVSMPLVALGTGEYTGAEAVSAVVSAVNLGQETAPLPLPLPAPTPRACW